MRLMPSRDIRSKISANSGLVLGCSMIEARPVMGYRTTISAQRAPLGRVVSGCFAGISVAKVFLALPPTSRRGCV